MAIIHIDNLGSGGINRDLEPYQLPPELWSAGNNVRFLNSRVQKFLGTEELWDTWASGTSPSAWSGFTVPLWLMPWNSDGTPYWLAPSATRIVRAASTGVDNVTRGASGAGVGTPYNGTDTTIWSGAVLGGVPILNNDSGLDYPQSWNSSTNTFQDLPNWTANTYCKIFRTFKQYGVALDIKQSSGTREAHTVKWSSPALPGNVPGYWDNGDNNDSNEQPLSEGGGILIDAQPMRDFLVIYKEEATYLMQLTSGPFVMNFRRVFDQSGLLAPRCAKAFGSKHFVVTLGDVAVHDGQQLVSVIDRRNRNWLFNNISTDDLRRTYVAPNYANNEMWVCFKSSSASGDYCDMALVWNYLENSWGVRELPNVPHIGYGTLADSTSMVIDDQTGVIDLDTRFIDGAAYAAGQLRMIASNDNYANKTLIQFDKTNTENGTAMTSSVERTGLAIVGQDRLGNPVIDQSSMKLVRRVWPKIESTGPVNIYIGAQSRIEGGVSWSGPFVFDPLVDSHIDCRVRGRAIAYKIESTTDIEWSTTGWSMDVEVIGVSAR